MPKKSVFAQLDARAVPPHRLMPSPRCWNPGLLRYRNKVWLGYRYHRAETKDARCGIAMCVIDPKTAEPLSDSQRLELSDPSGTGHQEDCRFFIFRGEPYISYTDMVGYKPGVDYTCIVKFARLKLVGKKWEVVQEWCPRYGNNTGFSKEKNWVFFEHDGELFCIYATDPQHIVLRMKDGAVVEEFKTPGPEWGWGHIRGGTPPVDFGDGTMMAIAHSSIPTEEPPHFVRYYGLAYVFEKRAPFRITQVSEIPVISGSEEDGHRVDPRYNAGWKPYIGFPAGLLKEGDGWIVSFGVNDWRCGIGRLTINQLRLGAPDGSSFTPRFFMSRNGTRPVRYIGLDQKPVFIGWNGVKSGPGCSAGVGYMKAVRPREAVEASEWDGAISISESEYSKAMRPARR